MLFNSDHLDSKFDRLTLKENCKQENIKGNDNSGRAINMADTINDDVAARSSNVGRSTRSLLSSSLAGERNESEENKINDISEYPNPYIDIDERMDMEADIMDDHPEPIILASSVGKEMDGRMIPSSSTISLLSLNAQNNDNGYNMESIEHGGNSGNEDFGNTVSPKTLSNNQFTGKYTSSAIPSNPNSQAAFMDRKAGHNNITSRNSLTHLNQQRLQQYQRFPAASLQISGPQLEMGLSATSQSIPIENKSVNVVPDSPNLDPISVGGSPSGLWLSNQTPSRSSSGSNNNSRNQFYYMLQQQQHQQQQQQSYPHHTTQPILSPQQTQPLQTTNQMLSNASSSSNYTTTSTLDYLKFDGSTSPILHPVLTPSEDPPMTPLYLNSNFSLGDAGYFGNITE